MAILRVPHKRMHKKSPQSSIFTEKKQPTEGTILTCFRIHVQPLCMHICCRPVIAQCKFGMII